MHHIPIKRQPHDYNNLKVPQSHITHGTQNTGSQTTSITWKCHTHISLTEPRGRDTEHRESHDYNNLEVPHSHITHGTARKRHRTQGVTRLQ